MGGEVGVEEGEALQDAFHQTLGRAVLPAASTGLWMEQGLKAAGSTHPVYHPHLNSVPQVGDGHGGAALFKDPPERQVTRRGANAQGRQI